VNAAVWGLIGTIVGAAASIATTWIAARSSNELQRERLREEREDRTSLFQRQTLLELQEAIHDALRLVCQAHLEDLHAHRSNKEWRKNMLTEEVDEGIRLAQRRVSILVERIASDDVRTSVKSLMSAATKVLFASSELESHLLLKTTNEAAEPVFELLGTTLRRHD
jgi:gas vesicle protein